MSAKATLKKYQNVVSQNVANISNGTSGLSALYPVVKEVRLENGAVSKGVIVMNLDPQLRQDHVICKSVQWKQLGLNGRNYHLVHRPVEVASRQLVVNVLMELLELMMDAISMNI